MYKERLNQLKVNEMMNVFGNVQQWRNNATSLRKETGKVFHIKRFPDYTLIIRIV